MPADPRTKMTALAESFPTLRKAPGVSPWDPHKLVTWRDGPAPGSGARHAASFVLNVWNSYGFGTFDAVSAMAEWDNAHRAAFAAWVAAPWFA